METLRGYRDPLPQNLSELALATGVYAPVSSSPVRFIFVRLQAGGCGRLVGLGRVFIGHGGSRVWTDLRDFLRDRLELDWIEFNGVPVAGYTLLDAFVLV